MNKTTSVRMTYHFRKELRSKCVTLDEVAGRIASGYYQRRVNAVRLLDEVPTELGMNSGTIAAEGLPSIYPAWGLEGYTGLVLISFRIAEGQEILERLRRQVNLWQQTLMSFIGTSGQSLKVLIPYRLPDGDLPTDPRQLSLFQQYAYKRTAEYAFHSTGIRPEEVKHDGSEHFRISADAQVYLNAKVKPIVMEQPTEPMTERTAIFVKTENELSLDTQVLPGYTRREMARRVKTNTPDWEDNFRVWMRSMVSQWRSGLHAMYGAQMVLMFVGAQGTRKSSFMRMLLPRELMPFYIDRIDFANKKEALRAMSRFLLINIDEYDQIGKAQTAFLKHLIQRTDVKERKLYSSTFEQQQRYAAFCATTNSLVPLKDESGSRRYLVVEVNDVIDIDTQGDKQIDYRQLYAQIVEEIRHGCDYAFTGERERQIITNNADYYETPNVISLFEDHFSKPGAGDEVSLMSPTEILKALHSDPGNHSNATILGSYLRRKNYLRGEGKERRRYKLKPSCTETR